MTITSSLRFLYILGESGLLCGVAALAAAAVVSNLHSIGCDGNRVRLFHRRLRIFPRLHILVVFWSLNGTDVCSAVRKTLLSLKWTSPITLTNFRVANINPDLHKITAAFSRFFFDCRAMKRLQLLMTLMTALSSYSTATATAATSSFSR